MARGLPGFKRPSFGSRLLGRASSRGCKEVLGSPSCSFRAQDGGILDAKTLDPDHRHRKYCFYTGATFDPGCLPRCSISREILGFPEGTQLPVTMSLLGSGHSISAAKLPEVRNRSLSLRRGERGAWLECVTWVRFIGALRRYTYRASLDGMFQALKYLSSPDS